MGGRRKIEKETNGAQNVKREDSCTCKKKRGNVTTDHGSGDVRRKKNGKNRRSTARSNAGHRRGGFRTMGTAPKPRDDWAKIKKKWVWVNGSGSWEWGRETTARGPGPLKLGRRLGKGKGITIRIE